MFDNFYTKLRDYYWNYRFKRNLKHRLNINDYLDEAYAHIWHKSDYPQISKEYKLIQLGVLPADTIVKKITRLWNDQKYGTKFYKQHHKFEPEQYVKIGDLIVKEGQLHFSKMHVGLISGPPDYLALGTGTPTPTLADFALQTPAIRANILGEGGYRDLIGEDEYYGMIWPLSVGTNNYGEAALFVGKDSASGDTMITHNKFVPVLQHTVNDNAPGVDIVIKHRSYTA